MLFRLFSPQKAWKEPEKFQPILVINSNFAFIPFVPACSKQHIKRKRLLNTPHIKADEHTEVYNVPQCLCKNQAMRYIMPGKQEANAASYYAWIFAVKYLSDLNWCENVAILCRRSCMCFWSNRCFPEYNNVAQQTIHVLNCIYIIFYIEYSQKRNYNTFQC